MMRYWTSEEDEAIEAFLDAQKDLHLLKSAELLSMLEEHLKNVTKPGDRPLKDAQIRNKLTTMKR